MAATFAALLLAHVLADFVLQTAAMVRGKDALRVQLAHAATVLGATFLIVQGPSAEAFLVPLAIAAVHAGIDRIKRQFGDTLAPFLVDQAAHVASLAAASALFPQLWADSVWAAIGPEALPAIMVHLALGLAAVRGGRFAVEKLLSALPHPPRQTGAALTVRPAPQPGLPDAGARIGELERLVAYGLVVTGQLSGVAFLLAAKSVLRFESTRGDRAAAETIILGTLASVGWALAAAAAAIWLTSQGDMP
ncbi:hypothetical protein OCH239_03140 [Roseivivax halodurans JCM 10272]|uniref:DUF3307 domain-containing protein n=1 Tax=Roseivivax halodurans JCM 10272 TaxID=1449350 RepID=X7EHG4_9RHOB|nr:DUF3307 domain-containing protein [Roseivivax halodurans]ETX14568.1 hypothetical protein OCH239_03140 [Roseivivax halodurans JCM 10272]